MDNVRGAKGNNNTIYMAGNESGYLVILKSNDRGLTWQNPIEHPSLANYAVRALGCIASSDNDILLMQGFDYGKEWAIFRSENGGVSWEKVLYIPTTQTWAPNMYFYKTSWGQIFTSSLIDGDLRIYSSSDLGITWRIRYWGTPTQTLANSHSTYRIVEGDNYRLVANFIQISPNAYESGWHVLTSPDGGNSWGLVQTGVVASGSNINIYGGASVRLANGTLVVLMGSYQDNTLCIAYSTDNGANWTRRRITGYPLVSGIAVQNSVVFSTADNKIYKLNDIVSGTPTQVATTTYPITDFLGFEST